MVSYKTFELPQNGNSGKSDITISDIESSKSSKNEQKIGHKGLSVLTAAVFITGEMAGSGVLALPKAIVDTGGSIGIVLLVVFCVNAGFGGHCLGNCWNILEERYPEYRTSLRNPYSTIAYKAVGKCGSMIVSVCIQITLFGAGTVYLLLSSQILQQLLRHYLPNISFCIWFLVIAVILILPMWLESPKDFWAVGVTATLTTVLSCILMFVQMLLDSEFKISHVKHKVHNFHDFFLAFGTLLFAFGGASTFPTIQNDMVNKRKFSISVVIAFTVILFLYLPVAIGGYLVYGEHVQTNVAVSLGHSPLSVLANMLMGIHLVFAFLIVINPVCQELEEAFDIPCTLDWKRCLLRTIIVFIMVFVGESIPAFGKILSLVGGSTITLLTFVFPPYFYMKLCSQKNANWPERHLPLYYKMYLWELIIIGIIGGSAATYNAVISIFGSGMARPCYWP
ncbi:hypothetical protein RN001_010009 [Aquatica leii]|uniref:Amino acid transporter transmembrane domain-containing protein n=1 Tax=Aquatica leii TaxID=1421715 RepID=A0AAN7QH68_9COLE|nr:hypothetical protein RN001_010009 [Aquatica leii]